MYTRNNNPNRQALEQGVSALEGGFGAAAFGSGTAAAMALFQALAPGGSRPRARRCLLRNDATTARFFSALETRSRFHRHERSRGGKKSAATKYKTGVDGNAVESALRIVDLAAVAKIVREAGAISVCDNTWAPIIQRPFDLGCDFILHSTTKYFGGHCDVLGGIIVAKIDNEFFQRVRAIQYSGGAVPSPFDCWLILRGMRTLPWRMRAHCENAAKVAEFLAQDRHVERVHYPGLTSHPGHDIATKQMSMFGGMLSFEVKGGREPAMNVAAKTKIFIRATSLGGVESLIEHRASIEGPGTTSPEGLLRLSIGLENADDLIEDLAQALR